MSKKATVSKSTSAPRVAHPVAPVVRLRLKAWDGALVLAVAALFRLLWLDRAAFRADSIHFWSMAERKLSFGQVWSQWLQILGDSAQFPLPAALAMVPTSLLGLPLSAFSVRLNDALFGILAAGAAWLAGRLLGGRRFGMIFGLFVALNPLHIQLAREAYFYSTLVAGAFLLLACAVRALRFPGARWSAGWTVLWLLGLFLTAYSHFTGWILAGVTVLTVAIGLGRRAGNARGQAVRLTAAAVAIALPLTWLPWALPYTLKRLADPGAKAESIRVMGAVKTPIADMLAGYAQKMMWGTSLWGTLLLVAGTVALVALLVRGGRKRLLRGLALMAAAGLGAYLLVMKSQGMYEAVRHAIYLFPLVALLPMFGLYHLPRTWPLRRVLPARVRSGLGYGLVVLALLVQLPGAWAALRITGSPTPYKDLQAWGNQHLAHGTPVLVDRWFEPWNEMRVYPSTNVVFMFTRPNEPLDVFLQTRWRDGAERFLRDNPDAAFMEVARTYSSEPGVGTWMFPRTYFKNRTVVANEAGLTLRRLGQAFREDFFAVDTNRVVVEVFYNTREDALAVARLEGRSLLAWPGTGWRYMKSGPVGAPMQTPDFMDWRLMEREATLEVHNLAGQPQTVQVKLRAFAPRGSKTLAESRLGQHAFAPGRLDEWTTSPVEVPPGLTTLVLRDAYGSDTPLLVQQWRVEPVATP